MLNMNRPARMTESELWPSARDSIHFIGICGAGKSTLCGRMAKRIGQFGGKVIGTVDYDPHTPDHERAEDRAFSRILDRQNSQGGYAKPTVHREIVDRTISMLERWMRSDANVVLVDRWYESYDKLPADHIRYIEAAIQSSGFRVHHFLLVVADSIFGNEESAIRKRMLHTKATRPGEWWDDGQTSLEAWVRSEQAYQEEYRQFCDRSPFPAVTMNTVYMDWDKHEQSIPEWLIQDRWMERRIVSSNDTFVGHRASRVC